MKKRLFPFVLFCLSSSCILAQTDEMRSFLLAAKMQSGFVINHKKELVNLSQRPTMLFQADVSVLKNSEKTWDYCNCYSKNGVSLIYADLGNKNELGEVWSAVFYGEPYLSLGKNAHFTFRAGVGPAYLNKVYDEVSNPNNFYYSMHLSYLITLNANFYYSISPSTRLSLTAQFNHISNGGTRTPNYGMNFPTSGIGIEHNLGEWDLQARERKDFTDKSLKFMFAAFAGPRIAKAFPGIPEERRLITGIHAGVLKPLGRVSSIGVGGEWYHDPISKVYEERKGERFETDIASVSVQHFLFFGKVFFGQHFAFYITPHNSDIDTNFYQRYVVGYRITDNLFAGVNLKVHAEVADHAAFTTGIIF